MLACWDVIHGGVHPFGRRVLTHSTGQHKSAAWAHYPGNVGQRAGWVGHEVDRVSGERRIDGVVLKGDVDAIAEHQLDSAFLTCCSVPCRRLAQHGGRYLDASDRVPFAGQQVSRSALAKPNLQDGRRVCEAQKFNCPIVGGCSTGDHDPTNNPTE